MDLIVKPARSEDVAPLATILTQAMQYKLNHGDNVWGSEPYTEAEVQRRLPKGNTYVAWFNGELAATLMLVWEDEMVWGKQPPIAAYVHQLAVKDGYHGRDVGGQLLNWAGEQAAKKNRTLLRIDVPPENTGLKAYYEDHGFTWVQDREVHTPDHTYVAALYERAA